MWRWWGKSMSDNTGEPQDQCESYLETLNQLFQIKMDIDN